MAVAAETGMGNRINTIMQPCFFHLSGVLPADEAIERIKGFVKKTYGKRGDAVVKRNYAAIDASIARLGKVTLGVVSGDPAMKALVPDIAPDFVQHVTARIMAGDGDLLPVSALPVDGTFPTGTTKCEKRAIAQQIPVWDETICIDCGKCAMVCPHASIRMKVYPETNIAGPRRASSSKEFKSRDLPGHRLTIQVAPDDCTGCGVCVDVCPAKSKTDVGHKSINMEPYLEHRDVERERWDAFLCHPAARPVRDPARHRQGRGPARAAVRVQRGLRRLRRDAVPAPGHPAVRRPDDRGQRHRLLQHLRRQPADHPVHRAGRRPRSGMGQQPVRGQRGVRPGHAPGPRRPVRVRDQAGRDAHALASRTPIIGEAFAAELIDSPQDTEAEIVAQRERVAKLRGILEGVTGEHAQDARQLLALSTDLVKQGVWIVGGDGWAYDIGYGGLDQVLSSGRNVNILVLDTEVYSNTGGQASKATPRGAVAKFAAAGKSTGKKDLGAIARAYGNVFVAQIALGANDAQSIKALIEAEAWPGPSLVIAYSTCIAHGIDMSKSMSHQKDAVKSGYWPLYRFQPCEVEDGTPFKLDSAKPSMPISEFVATETRFAILQRTDPERAAELAELIQADADERWRYYEQLAGMHRSVPHLHAAEEDTVAVAELAPAPTNGSNGAGEKGAEA